MPRGLSQAATLYMGGGGAGGSAPAGIVATGGTETTVTIGGTSYKIHTFNSSGTFAVTSGGSVDIQIVGGGGSSGSSSGSYQTGGGGGGRVQYLTNQTVTAQNYTITIGAGGTGGVNDSNNGGSTSALGTTIQHWAQPA